MRIALITGILGQDGTYLTRLLKGKGYIVRPLEFNSVRPALEACAPFERVEIYNLAGKTHVGDPHTLFEVNTLGLLHILEGVRTTCPHARIFQASSSELFGNTGWSTPQDETTPLAPRTIYGVSKTAAHLLVQSYRQMYGTFACSGILYNHESPLRPDLYVTQKIIKGIQSGTCITLGNLDATRDWGHAEDYVEAMWRMLQQDTPDDYIVATGVSHSVREFIGFVSDHRVSWSEDGTVGTIDGKPAIRVSDDLIRNETTRLIGNPTKLEGIGWKRNYDIHGVIEDMMRSPPVKKS